MKKSASVSHFSGRKFEIKRELLEDGHYMTGLYLFIYQYARIKKQTQSTWSEHGRD